MDPPSPPYWSEEEILELHEAVIGLFGGVLGIRDRGALESCLAQPKMAVFGRERFPGICEKAAAYCFFIARNHPFLDGNKRTAFLAALGFLRNSGVTPEFDEDQMYDAIINVVEGRLTVDELAEVFRGTHRE